MKAINPSRIASIFILVASILLLSDCIKSEYYIDPESLEIWEIYNTENGLGCDSVWTLAEDQEGNIWVGTMYNGVSKFDGKTWTNYTTEDGLLDNSVLSIAQDGYGYMWFGTRSGLSIFYDNTWTNITDFGGVRSILRDYDDNIWIATSDYAVMEYKNSTWHQYYDSECEWCNVVNVIFEDKERNIWLGSDQDLKKIDDQTVITYTQSDGIPGSSIKSIGQDMWGNIWVGSTGSSNVARYNNGIFEQVALSNGLAVNIVSSIAADNRGNVWFGLFVTGAMKFNGSIMESFTVKDGLPGRSVTIILKDKHGYLWFGTIDGGVAKYMPGLD